MMGIQRPEAFTLFNAFRANPAKPREGVRAGDATIDRAAGTGWFGALARLGVKNGFSYSGRNMAFGAAGDENGRGVVATDSAAFRGALGIPENSPKVRIDAQIANKSGDIVFIGGKPTRRLASAVEASLGGLPSLHAAYPADEGIDYPKLVDENVDGVLTSTKGLTLEMITRDCMAAMVVVQKPGIYVAGLVHAGWRQVDGGIGTHLVATLTGGGNIEPKDIRVAIGPALRKGRMVLQHLDGIDDAARWGSFIAKEADGFHVDFIGMFKRQLVDAGVPAENILDSGIDTYDANAAGVGHSARYQEEHDAPRTSMLTVLHT